MIDEGKRANKHFTIHISGTIHPDGNINLVEQKFIDFVNELRKDGIEVDKAEFDE